MATRKAATEKIPLPPPGKVKVREERVYLRDAEPEPAVEALEEDESDLADPLTIFAGMVEPTDQYTMRIWRLPKYEEDGRVSANGSVREACGTVAYSAEDDFLIDRIREKVPAGGYVLLELTSRGKFVDQGVMKLAPLPGHHDHSQQQQQRQNGQPSGPLVVMHQPHQPQQSIQPIDPMAQAEQGMSFAMKLVDMAKKLAPEPQPVTINAPQAGQGEAEPKGLEDRLLETVITKAIEGDTEGKRLDKVLDALAGRSRNTGIDWSEMLGGITRALLPLVAQFGAQYMVQRNGGQVSANSPVQIEAGVAQAAMPQTAPALPDNPADRAWVFCVRHMLENIANGVSPRTSASEVLDLLDQYEHLESIVEPILLAEPTQAIELIAAWVPQVIGLKDHAGAVAWIARWQKEARKMVAEQEADEQEADGEEQDGITE